MKQIFRYHAVLIVLAMCGLFFTGCLETSTVVKVKKDGSGILHERNYTNMSAGMGALGGAMGENVEGDLEDEGPSEEEMKEKATAMGEGVTLKTFKKNTNKSGWKGFEAIYAFEDINNLKVDMDMGDGMEMGEEEDGEKKDETITFTMVDGKLTIKTPPMKGEDDAEGEKAEEEDINLMGGAGGKEMMAMMAPMLKGARMGLFIEIDGEIAETNAKHQKGNLITIVKADLGKVFSNPDAMKEMEKLEDQSREAAQEIADKMEGLDMDTQEEITVEIK